MDEHVSTYKVYTFQTDFKGKAKITAICDWLQEIAGEHAKSLGFSQQDLHDRGMLWALYRFSIQILEVPVEGDELHCKTWVSTLRGPFSEREFSILGRHGTEIAKATSLWFALDASSRKPTPIGNIGRSKDLLKGPKSMEGPARLKIPEGLQQVGETSANYHHMDSNQHVNNVRYMELVLGAVEREKWRKGDISKLDINYLKEIDQLHQPLFINYQSIANDHDFYLLTNEQNEPLVSMQIQWIF